MCLFYFYFFWQTVVIYKCKISSGFLKSIVKQTVIMTIDITFVYFLIILSNPSSLNIKFMDRYHHKIETLKDTNYISDELILAPLSIILSCKPQQFFFVRHLSEFENFLLCERILINVKTKRQANFKNFKRFGALRGLSNKKKSYSTRSCVNCALFEQFTIIIVIA
jgi:hypothetical protein